MSGHKVLVELSEDEQRPVAMWWASYPYRIVYVARHPNEETIVSAVHSRRIPNKLAREGWQVMIVQRGDK